jgi:hypothetical protein
MEFQLFKKMQILPKTTKMMASMKKHSLKRILKMEMILKSNNPIPKRKLKTVMKVKIKSKKVRRLTSKLKGKLTNKKKVVLKSKLMNQKIKLMDKMSKLMDKMSKLMINKLPKKMIKMLKRTIQNTRLKKWMIMTHHKLFQKLRVTKLKKRIKMRIKVLTNLMQ